MAEPKVAQKSPFVMKCEKRNMPGVHVDYLQPNLSAMAAIKALNSVP